MSKHFAMRESQEGGFFVDVGEEDLFYVELEGTELYEEIYRSRSSVLVCALSTEGEKTTIRVSWSRFKRIAQGRGYKGMAVCDSLEYVPEMYSRELHTIGSTYIEVSTRQYIDGCPLSEAWSYMSEQEKVDVIGQMESVVHSMSQFTSESFMELQGRNLSTQSPVLYINYRMLLSMITQDLEKGDMRLLDMEDFSHSPVLCHGNLSMEHVIVRGSSVVGIVGWSKCDYIPEVMDRMQYQFSRPKLEGESAWYAALSRMDLFHPPPPPLYTVCCMYYSYYLRLRSTPPDYHGFLEGRLFEISGEIIPSVRDTYMGVDIARAPERGDRRSLAEHSSKEGTLKNPFELEQDIQSCIESVASWEDWEDNGTVIDILDKLSVA